MKGEKRRGGWVKGNRKEDLNRVRCDQRIRDPERGPSGR